MTNTEDYIDIKGTYESIEISVPNKISKIPLNTTDPFRAPNGSLLVKGIFFETNRSTSEAKGFARGEETRGIYSLKDTDHTYEGRTYPSLKRLYLEEADLTEYAFATKYLSSYAQWVRLCQASWFKEHLQAWRTELELQITSQALKRIVDEALEGGKNAYNANKFIVEKGWISKTSEPSRRGRPSKAEIAKAAAEEVFSDQQTQDALKRLGLN